MLVKISTGSRYLLGLIFFVFGLNGFLQFIPPPPNMPETAMAFFNALVATKYFFPLLKGTEVVCGALLLSGFAAPLALVILAPISIQIFFFHACVTPGIENLFMPIAIIAFHILAAKKYWPMYRPLFNRYK